VQCGGVSLRGESRIYGNRERLKRSGRTGRILIVYEPLSLAFEMLRSRCGGTYALRRHAFAGLAWDWQVLCNPGKIRRHKMCSDIVTVTLRFETVRRSCAFKMENATTSTSSGY